MIVYRLCLAGHSALDGEGARLYGGRWNSPGRPAVYTAATASLALLEILVHLDLTPDLLPPYRLLQIELPDTSPFEALPHAPTAQAECIRSGDDFLERGAALSLRVPSVIVPQEQNTILNPRHPDAAALRVVSDEPFPFDPRLLD